LLRSEFWITKSRNYIKKIIHECRICRKHEGSSYKYPAVPPLPIERVTLDNAFVYSGIDYAGPVFVKNIYGNKNSTFKAWIVVITCANSRAVYLDLVNDLSGSGCVNILKRYFSIMGAPRKFISDNGSAFISKEVKEFTRSRNIDWKYNIEAAPWTGGFFEIMVKSVKRCLKKVLGNAKVNFDEFVTILKSIQNIINNRPLTYIYDDIIEPISPNHLIFGRKIYSFYTGNEIINDK